MSPRPPFKYRVWHLYSVGICLFGGMHIVSIAASINNFIHHQQNPGNHAVKLDGVWERPGILDPVIERIYAPNRRHSVNLFDFDNPQLNITLEEEPDYGMFKPPRRCLRCSDEILDIGRSQSWNGAIFCSYDCKRHHFDDPTGSAQTPYLKCTLCKRVIEYYVIHDPEIGADGSYCSWKCFSNHTYRLREADKPLDTGAAKPSRLDIRFNMASRGAREKHSGRNSQASSSSCYHCGRPRPTLLGHEFELPTGTRYCSVTCVQRALGHEID